ncbi:MAG: hypothetical protein PHH93_04365, partial [Prolixibacteraceae bacterium]|nr:hypothetical protein [Prolixibacteraceae bacterium]
TYAGIVDGIPSVTGPNGVAYGFNSSLYAAKGSDFLNYAGTTIPPHTLGWVNNFSAYGFDLMVVFVGKFGGVFREPIFNYPFVGSSKTIVNMFVTDFFDNGTVLPSLPESNADDDHYSLEQLRYISNFIASSSYLECKEINLQYSIPSKLIKGSGLSDLRIFAQIRNAGMIWLGNDKGLNPEWLPGTQSPVTAFTFGINAKF